MATTTKGIREWAAANGYQLGRGRTPDRVIDDYVAAHPGEEVIRPNKGGVARGWKNQDAAVGVSDGAEMGELERPPSGAGDFAGGGLGDAAAPPRPAPTTTGPAAEVPPSRTGRTFGQRVKDKFSRKGKRGKGSRSRESTEDLFSLAWTGLAKLIGVTGYYPLAKTVAMQAPVAGVILDNEIRGSLLDPLAQPAARLLARSSKIGTLMWLPMLVHACSVRPELFPRLKPMLINAIYDWQEIAGPEIKKMEDRRKQRAEESGIDPEEMLAYLFADMPRHDVRYSDQETGPSDGRVA